MKINLERNGRNLTLSYDDNGVLEHITDSDTDKKLMIEYTQIGSGYEMSNNNGYVKMSMCSAVYVRITELNIFVPKFIFIPEQTNRTCSACKHNGINNTESNIACKSCDQNYSSFVILT